MSFIQKPREENSAYLQLLMLLLYAALGLAIFLVLGMLVLFAVYGMELINNPDILRFGDIRYRPALQIVLAAQSLGLFLAPALFLALMERQKINTFYGFKVPRLNLIGITILIMLISMPFMEGIAVFNQKLSLPDFLKGLEAWMRNSEDALKATTVMLLSMSGIKDLLINILLIALLPALAEELMFRGALQRIFARMFKNPHVAIWISAIIFSAIHMQFYGFLPRMFLGAGFGYLYWWSGSIWYAVLGHFLNNAYAVCVAFYMQQQHLPWTEESGTPQFAWYGHLISFVLTVAVFLYFKKQSDQQVSNPSIS